MSFGWIGSALTHAVLLGLLLFAWSASPPSLPMAGSVVPVDIVDKIADKTNIRGAAPEAPETPTPTDSETQGTPQEMQPRPDAPEAIADPRQKKKTEQPRQATTSLDAIRDMLDRSRPPGNVKGGNSANRGERARDVVGEGTDMVASEADAISSAIDQRWTNPADLPDPESYWVIVRIQINADGSLAGQPVVVRTSLPQSNPYMRTVVERSVRAIYAAEPLPVASNRTKRATFTMRFQKRT